jgi:hypothetical protein
MPLKTPFIWLVWASNVKDDTLYVLGKNIALERKTTTYGKIVGRIWWNGKIAGKAKEIHFFIGICVALLHFFKLSCVFCEKFVPLRCYYLT